jgi:hypothetical protein
LAYVTARLAGRFAAPESWKIQYKNRHARTLGRSLFPETLDKALGNLSVFIAGTYEAYKTWGKEEKKRLRVDDINADIYTVAAPTELKTEVEQNAHIQDGIRKILADGPQTGHQDALAQSGNQREAGRT